MANRLLIEYWFLKIVWKIYIVEKVKQGNSSLIIQRYALPQFALHIYAGRDIFVLKNRPT